MRTEQEITEQLDRATDVSAQGNTTVPGMTYEDGVDAALRWVLGWQDEGPMDDD